MNMPIYCLVHKTLLLLTFRYLTAHLIYFFINIIYFVMTYFIIIDILIEFWYSISGVPERYLTSPLILAIDFYCVINKLKILVPDSY
jgi:hypothetical protein